MLGSSHQVIWPWSTVFFLNTGSSCQECHHKKISINTTQLLLSNAPGLGREEEKNPSTLKTNSKLAYASSAQIGGSRWEFIMAWSCSLFYTLVTLSFGKGLPKRMETMRAEGVKPIQIFPFSSCALVAKQQHFNCDWYKQLGFNGNLSPRFKPSFYWCNLLGGCWLCYLLREKERKQNRSVDLFSCPVW